MGENQAIPRLLFSEELEHGPARRRKHLHSHLQRYVGKIEKIIADFLTGDGLEYLYEPVLRLDGVVVRPEPGNHAVYFGLN